MPKKRRLYHRSSLTFQVSAPYFSSSPYYITIIPFSERCIMPNKLYVGNIPFQVSEEELNELFSSCGDVTNIHLPQDSYTGRPKGFGFVEMESEEGMNNALQSLNGKNLGGRQLKVDIAVERTTSPNKLYAKDIGTGLCTFCGQEDTIYGFDPKKGGACFSCISSLSKAARHKKPQHNNRY